MSDKFDRIDDYCGCGDLPDAVFADLPRETREIINMKGRNMVEKTFPKGLQKVIFDAAEKLNVSIDVVALAEMQCFSTLIAGKCTLTFRDKTISLADSDNSILTPFKSDYRRAVEYFEAIIDELRREREEKNE